MEIIKTKLLSESQFQQINQLWNEEYPLQLKDRFEILLHGIDDYHHYLIEDEQKNVIAWAVDFKKDAETRFSIIVHKDYQGKGLGKSLLKRLQRDLGEFYGWVIDHNNDKKENGEYYQSPLMFYVRNGFEVLYDMQIDSEILKAVKIRRKSE